MERRGIWPGAYARTDRLGASRRWRVLAHPRVRDQERFLLYAHHKVTRHATPRPKHNHITSIHPLVCVLVCVCVLRIGRSSVCPHRHQSSHRCFEPPRLEGAAARQSCLRWPLLAIYSFSAACSHHVMSCHVVAHGCGRVGDFAVATRIRRLCYALRLDG